MTVDHKKLEKRIHNQRVALRETWEIVEMRRREGKGNYEKPKWFEKVLEQGREIKRLKQRIAELEQSN